MTSDRKRLLELALDALQAEKRKIDDEIAGIRKELGYEAGPKVKATGATAGGKVKTRKKPPQFTKAERQKRSQRMKAYWEKWRKDKAKAAQK